MQVIPFHCVFISNGALFGDDVKKFVSSLTVNVVIFAGGNFCVNVGKAFHVGVFFTILLLFPS